jgi:hypothetical protein
MDMDSQDPLIMQLLAAKNNHVGVKEAIEVSKQVEEFESFDTLRKNESIEVSRPAEELGSFNTTRKNESIEVSKPAKEFESFDTMQKKEEQETEISKPVKFESFDTHEEIQEDIPEDMSESLSQIEPPYELVESSYTTSEMTISPAGSVVNGLDYFEDIAE